MTCPPLLRVTSVRAACLRWAGDDGDSGGLFGAIIGPALRLWGAGGSILSAPALVYGGRVIIGTFALDGPDRCSGLPVTRYSSETLAARFDDRFRVLTTHREEHRTPGGAAQPFSRIVLTKKQQGRFT